MEESTPLAPLKEAEEQDGDRKVEVTRDTDSGNETLLDTDSEPDEHEKIDQYAEAIGWNVSFIYHKL